MRVLQTIIEHLCFLVLGVMSVHFADERLLADSSYYFIRVIHSEWFWVEHYRLILVLPELAPLIGVLLKLKLSTLVILYSLGHVVFFYAIYFVSRFHYGNLAAGPIILLIQTLGIKSGFFVPMFELYYAGVLLILLFSILIYRQRSWKDMALLIVLTLFIASAHFFAIVLLAIVLTWHAMETRLQYWKTYVPVVITVASIMIFKKFHVSDYEQGKMDAFLNGLRHFQPDRNYLNGLWTFLTAYYREFLALSALTALLLLWLKKFGHLLLYLASFFALTVMVTVAYTGFEPSRYQEQVYFPITFLVAFAFVMVISPIQRKLLRHGLLTIGLTIFIIRFIGIQEDGHWFTERQNEIRKFVGMAQERPGTKFVVHESALDHDANWSYPIESLILSAEEFDKTVTICTDLDWEHDQNSEHLQPDEFLFRRWELYPISELNPDYFELDTSTYVFLTSLE